MSAAPITRHDRGPARPESLDWLKEFVGDQSDGVFLVTAHDPAFLTFHRNQLLGFLGSGIKVVYSERGNTRPGRERRKEHFGFRDGVSQPGIRGLTRPSRPSGAPDQGLPGQDLLWPGEFILGYPGQDPRDARKPGPIAPLPAPWAKNGSYMVFRRLEQRVPEFNAFVKAQAARFGMYLSCWRRGWSDAGNRRAVGAGPARRQSSLAVDDRRNNDFGYAGDPWQRACPFRPHPQDNPRDDVPTERAEMLRHRIIRQGIPFGPEVAPGGKRRRSTSGA
jgi:deferrochelatase/peroxidase EfeB